MTPFESFVGTLAECLPSDWRVLELHLNVQDEYRLEYLHNKASEGTLSEADRAEHEELLNVIGWTESLKARSRFSLESACATPEVARSIVDFRPADEVVERLDFLRIKANEGSLSEEERAEYQGFVQAIDLVGWLKAIATSPVG